MLVGAEIVSVKTMLARSRIGLLGVAGQVPLASGRFSAASALEDAAILIQYDIGRMIKQFFTAVFAFLAFHVRY